MAKALPWLRNTTQTSPQSNPQGTAQPNAQGTAAQGQDQGQGQGKGQTTTQQTEWWQAIDWRILLLAFGGLSIAFTLIFAGYSALKK